MAAATRWIPIRVRRRARNFPVSRTRSLESVLTPPTNTGATSHQGDRTRSGSRSRAPSSLTLPARGLRRSSGNTESTKSAALLLVAPRSVARACAGSMSTSRRTHSPRRHNLIQLRRCESIRLDITWTRWSRTGRTCTCTGSIRRDRISRCRLQRPSHTSDRRSASSRRTRLRSPVRDLN